MFDDSKISCTNAYADSQGGCLAGTLEMDDRAAIIAKNASAKALGGAVAGGYPKQYLIVRGNATIDIDDSYAGLYGGAMFFWQNISFIGEAFEISLKNSAAQCGESFRWTIRSQGREIYLDDEGGTLYIKNTRELNSSKGCITVEANLISGTTVKPGPKIPQPCGQGCSGDLNISNACLCKLSFESSESGEFQVLWESNGSNKDLKASKLFLLATFFHFVVSQCNKSIYICRDSRFIICIKIKILWVQLKKIKEFTFTKLTLIIICVTKTHS